MSLQISAYNHNIVSTYVAPSSTQFVKAIILKEKMAKAERAAIYAFRAEVWGLTVKEYRECQFAGLSWGKGENLLELALRKKLERDIQKMSASSLNLSAINTLTEKREVI